MLKRAAIALGRRFHLLIDLAGFFYVQRITGFEPPRRPHLDGETTVWLSTQLQMTRSFLEFGCGGSTLLANDMAVPTISVESDRFYAAVVRQALVHPELAEILTPKMGITRHWGMPMFFKRRKGRRYVTAPFDRFGTDFPDLILVDGRYRVACALQSAARAARIRAVSTLLIDDYDQRPYYHHLEQYLGRPERIGRAATFLIESNDIPDEVISRYMADAR